MADNNASGDGAKTGTTDHLVVVYQFGKVASTALVAALNDCPGVEAAQSHFLGEAALQQTLSSVLNTGLNDYFFFHQSGQLVTNLKLTHRIGRILSGHDTRTRLTVLLTVRDPVDWFRSAITQDAKGLGDVFLSAKDRHGIAGETLASIVQPAVESILGKIADFLTPFGSIDACLADRPKAMASMRALVPDPSLQELFYAAVRPFDWHDLQFQPVFHSTLKDFSHDKGLWSLHRDRFQAHLFRYEDMADQLPRIASALGLDRIPLAQGNISEGKVFDPQIRAAFRSAAALRLAGLYADTDYARRFGYGPDAAMALAANQSGTSPGDAAAKPAAAPQQVPTGPFAGQSAYPTLLADILVCPSCRSATLPRGEETLVCPACAASFPRIGLLRDLRTDRTADTALDLASYDAHHNVTPASAEPLFRHYEATLRELGHEPRGRLLELGAGTGNLTLGLAHLGRFSDLWITDLSPRFLQRLVDRIGTSATVRPCLLDANALPFADGSFDIIVGHSILHHLLHFETTLRDTFRCLRPGGAAIFGEPIMDGNALIYLIARQILTLAEEGVGPAVSDGTRIVLEVIAGRGGVKAANLRKRDATVAPHEDKYIFPAGFLRDLCQDIGFSRVAVRPQAQDRDLGGSLRRNFLGIIAPTQARIEDLDPYLPLFDALTTAYAPGMDTHVLQAFSYLQLVK